MDMCGANCLKERFCKYHQKQIAKSILSVEAIKKKVNSVYAVDILFSSNIINYKENTLFYGRYPKKQNNQFIFIPLLNLEDLSSFSAETPSPNLVALKYKQY